MKWLLGVLIAATQGLNALTGGNPDQTLSGRTALAARSGKYGGVVFEALLDLVFAVLTGKRHHCERSIEWDELRTWLKNPN